MSARHFALRGARALVHRRVAELLERAPVIAWARPGSAPVVMMTAELYAQLTGNAIPAGTFAPSRFCARCTRFVGPGKRCSECVPPTCAARRAKRGRS